MAAGESRPARCPAPHGVPRARVRLPLFSAARCGLHAAALVVLAVTCSGQASPSGAAELWAVRCSMNCHGVNTCSDACRGEQIQIGKCPEVACPKADATICANGPSPCQFSMWSDWAQDTKCSGLCSRTRTVAEANKCGGDPCQGSLTDTKRCHSSCNPPKDCLWSPWGMWNSCGITVANQMERTRSIASLPKSGGMPCEGDTLQTKACGQARSTAHDCKVTDWMDWAPCDHSCGGGQKIRFRTIMTKASGGGKACPGALSVTEGCGPPDSDPCLVGNGAPMDCALGPWTVWTSCDMSNQKHRQRVVQSRLQNGGKACQGTLAETQSCGSSNDALQDCILEEWNMWSHCDKTCDGGQTYRERNFQGPKNGGKACTGALKETRECAVHSCELGGANGGCTLEHWSEWTPCSMTCGAGSQHRERDIVAQAHSGGKGCSQSLAQTRGCPNLAACSSTDCAMEDWGAWSTCDRSCGGGQSSRSRHIVHDALAGGKTCSPGSMTEYKSCNVGIPCPTECVDGLWGDWGGWDYCTKSCNGGHQSRERSISLPSNKCGKPATGANKEVKSCNDNVKCTANGDIDCQLGEWQDWSTCSSTCVGVRKRSRQVRVHGSGHGLYCGSGKADPLTQVESCGRPSGFGQAYESAEDKHYLSVCGLTMPQDCVLGAWGMWSLCSMTCTGGQRHRERQVEQLPAGSGKQCEESLSVTEPCNTFTACEGKLSSNCTVGDWSMWGTCVGCTGQRYRTRSLTEEPAGGGDACDTFESMETGGCEQHCPGQTHSPFFCIWTAWTHWSDCSQTCGSGYRTRSEMMAGTDMEPQSYAALAQTAEECYGERHQRGACNLGHCPKCIPKDCVVGEWSEWGMATCEGLSYRNRSVVVQPNECGKPCDGSLRSTRQAWPTDFSLCQPRDCQLSEWSPGTFCASTSAQSNRKREIKTFPTRDGEACVGALSKTESCLSILNPEDSSGAPKVDCKFGPWTYFGECSKTCGGGQRMRQRKVQSEARSGGEACTGKMNEIEPCNTQECFAGQDVDCTFGPWSVWTGCNKTSFQAYRKRHVLKGAVGQGKPCYGDTRETQPCPGNMHVDCELSPWTGWQQCSTTCFGGIRKRLRSVVSHATAGGKLCTGDLLQMEPCNSDKSCGPPQDCQLSGWSQWSVCIPSADSDGEICGDGHKVRKRTVTNPGEIGGKSCSTSLQEVSPCQAGRCAGTEDCLWQDWADWQPCVKAQGPCGVGYKRRERTYATLPKVGGKLCKPKTKDMTMPALNCQGQVECCINGKWGDWGQWSSCAATCGGSTRKRSRAMAVNATWCGKTPEGSDIEFGFCLNSNCSKVDCKFGDWSPWVPELQVQCPDRCSSGHVERKREIMTLADRSGAPCTGPTHEWQRCPFDPACGGTHSPLRKDCKLGPWSGWSACSRTCEGGQQTKTRDVLVYPEHGGADCSSSALKEVQGCNLGTQCNWDASKVNCKWSEWTMWSACIGGEMTRTRSVQTEAANGGDPCMGPQSNTTGCGNCVNHTYHCEWSTWSSWGACSQSCGTGGKRKRTRHLQVGASSGQGKMEAFSLPRLEARVGRAGQNQIKDLMIAFVAGAGVLLLMIGLRPLIRTFRWPVREEGQAPNAASEVGSSAAFREPGAYAALPVQHAQLEEGAAE